MNHTEMKAAFEAVRSAVTELSMAIGEGDKAATIRLMNAINAQLVAMQGEAVNNAIDAELFAGMQRNSHEGGWLMRRRALALAVFVACRLGFPLLGVVWLAMAGGLCESKSLVQAAGFALLTVCAMLQAAFLLWAGNYAEKVLNRIRTPRRGCSVKIESKLHHAA